MRRLKVICFLLCAFFSASWPISAAVTSVPGDVNEDGVFDAQDVNLALEAFLKGNLNFLIRPDLGDVSPDPSIFFRGYGDGQILSNDVNRLFRALSDIQTLPALPIIQINDISIGKDLQESVSGAISSQAPSGNLSITLRSLDPAKLLLSKSADTVGSDSIVLIVPAGSRDLPVFYLQALSGSGSVTLTATAPGFTETTSHAMLVPSGFRTGPFICSNCDGNLNTTASSSDTPFMIDVGRLNPDTLKFEMVQPLRAGIGPIPVNVTSDNVSVGKITKSPIVFHSEDASQYDAFRPQSVGSTALRINTPSGFTTPTDSQFFTAIVIGDRINLVDITIGKDLQAISVPSLGVPAPAGGVTMTLKVSDASKVRLSTDPDVLGSDTVAIPIPEGIAGPDIIYFQALAGAGTVTYTASAPGYISQTNTITLTPSGFVISTNCYNCGGDFSTTVLSIDTLIYVSPVSLDPVTFKQNGIQPLRPGLNPVSVTVTNDTPSIGNITNSPVVFNSDDPGQQTNFHPISLGTTILRISTPTGFSKPTDRQSLIATVNGDSIESLGYLIIGKDLQTNYAVYLRTPAPAGGITMTVRVSDASKVRLSTDPNVLGSDTVTIPIPEGNTFTSAIYFQALAGSGTVSYTASAPGYASQTATISLVPSGFEFVAAASFDTTVFASATSLDIYVGRLDPVTLTLVTTQPLRAGIGPISINVTSDIPSVGTVTISPVIFNSGDQSQQTAFNPNALGTTTLRMTEPTSFTTPTETPSDHQTLTADVNEDTIGDLDDLIIGKDLQVTRIAYMGAPAPTGGVTMTLKVSDASKVLLSTDPAIQGSDTITLPIAEGTNYSGAIYIQALSESGTLTYTASAPGYISQTATITLVPSGFVFATYVASFDTTLFASDTPLGIYVGPLDPITLQFIGSQPLRAGVGPVGVSVTSDIPSVGTIATSPVVFKSGDQSQQTAFHPKSVGTIILNVSTPTGFTTPVDAPFYNRKTLTVNVNRQ